jgi:hypothetical protein
VRRLIIIALFFEVGAVLVVVPWVPYWEHNYFIDARPIIEPLMMNRFVRGAISGLGLVNLFAGVAELGSLLFGPRAAPDDSPFDEHDAATPHSPQMGTRH